MPSYPDAVKSFTTKNAGDFVNASHMNDVQDEVNAVEAGLLNGTARLNSSRSTLATLSVSGASTFAVRPITPPPAFALVFTASTYAAGSSQFSTIAWTQIASTLGDITASTVTTPERLTPGSTGLYLATAQIGIASPSSLVNAIRILDSSNAAIANMRVSNSTDLTQLLATGMKYFDSTGGYLTVQFVGDGASSRSLSSGLAQTWFSLVKL